MKEITETRKKRPTEDIKAQATGGLNDACARYGLGVVGMKKVAEDAHAVIRVGKRYLVNFMKVDAYMNSISQ